ncbi:hypothetical protein KI387_028063, partial [Taxus chinensis]
GGSYGTPPCPGWRSRDHPRQGGGLVTEDQNARKNGGAEGKTKHAEAERGIRDTNVYLVSFYGSRTPCEETYIIIG